MNKSTFRDDLSSCIRGHVAKSIAPFRMFGIEHTSPIQNIHPSIHPSDYWKKNKRELLSHN